MKRVINGKVYDTDKAELIATVDHKNIKYGFSNDAPHETQSFYRKKTGEFFVYAPHGSLMARNIFQHDYDRYASGGFFPLTYQQAQKWAEHELSAEKWEEIFGDPEDDNSRVSLNLSMSAAEADTIKKAAAQAGISVSAYIVEKCT